MKFKLTTEHTYWWPVTVRMPDPDRAGATMEFAFNAHFRALPKSEAKALQKRLLALSDTGSDEAEAATIRETLTGWDEDVVDDQGRPVRFSLDALDAAMELPWFRRGVLAAYVASLQDGGPAAGN